MSSFHFHQELPSWAQALLNWALLASFIVQLSSIVLNCTQLCSIVLNCAQLYSTVLNCTQLRPIVLICAQLCSYVHNCAHMCTIVLICAQLCSIVFNCAQMCSTGLNIAQSSLSENMMSMNNNNNNKSLFLKRIALRALKNVSILAHILPILLMESILQCKSRSTNWVSMHRVV